MFPSSEQDTCRGQSGEKRIHRKIFFVKRESERVKTKRVTAYGNIFEEMIAFVMNSWTGISTEGLVTGG